MFNRRLGFVFSLFVLMIIGVGAVNAEGAFAFTLFRSRDNLTLYIPGNQPVDLRGLRYEAITATGAVIPQPLETLPSLMGPDYSRIQPPVCFQIERSGSTSPLSLECQTVTTFRQLVSDANVFWYDLGANTDRIVRIVIGATLLLCPAGNARCDLTYTPGTGQTVAPTDAPREVGDSCATAFDVDMRYVPPTTFFMGLSTAEAGANDERPGHDVTVSAFCIDAYEVTNAQYAECVNEGVCTPPENTDAESYGANYYEQFQLFPVVNVTWTQAQAFCAYRDGHLPTEAEWELVARHDPATGAMRTYSWGNQSPQGDAAVGDERANFAARVIKGGGQHPTGVSAYGVYDLSGNVAEWVFDGYAPYDRDANVDPMGDESAMQRVVRGGSYADDANAIRGGVRTAQSPTISANDLGFRCVLRQGD
ncbi:MAG: formylglycine-generating enzyme family protein [Chloroflexota bacterium]|nr:formylglycine-generating enzyme family protein [Chloroflexota bacterium]